MVHVAFWHARVHAETTMHVFGVAAPVALAMIREPGLLCMGSDVLGSSDLSCRRQGTCSAYSFAEFELVRAFVASWQQAVPMTTITFRDLATSYDCCLGSLTLNRRLMRPKRCWPLSRVACG